MVILYSFLNHQQEFKAIAKKSFLEFNLSTSCGFVTKEISFIATHAYICF